MPAGNALPDPWTGAASQPAYPWRGRITCDPAPGRPGSPRRHRRGGDAGRRRSSARRGDWRYRRMVLHYAQLARTAGGVDAFLIGSELRGADARALGVGVYPAVDALRRLAARREGDRSAPARDRHLRRGLDRIRRACRRRRRERGALSARSAVGVGGDRRGRHRLLPAARRLARRRRTMLDRADRPTRSTTATISRGNLRGGEAFDWYYAERSRPRGADAHADHRRRLRQAWVFRAKDSWTGGRTRMSSASAASSSARRPAWVPQGKPIWLTEIGCPGGRQGRQPARTSSPIRSRPSPRVPPFSQRRARRSRPARARSKRCSRASIRRCRARRGAQPGLAASMAGAMVDPDRDLRLGLGRAALSGFPGSRSRSGPTAPNWETGHWITGRLEGAPLDRLIAAILTDFGIDAPRRARRLDGFLDGYVIDRPMSARAALEPLARLYGFDAVASGGALALSGARRTRRDRRSPRMISCCGDRDATAAPRPRAGDRTAAQVELGFTDGRGRVSPRRGRLAPAAAARAGARAAPTRRRDPSRRGATLGGCLAAGSLGRARERASSRCRRAGSRSSRATSCPLPTQAGPRLHRVMRIADGPTRRVSTRAVEPAVFATPGAPPAPTGKRPPPVPGRPAAVVLDLAGGQRRADGAAMARGRGRSVAGRRRGLALRRRRELRAAPARRSTRHDRAHADGAAAGAAVAMGPRSRTARGGTVLWGLGRRLATRPRSPAATCSPCRAPDGCWEIFSAARAELIGVRRYRLSRLLRGLAGSETAGRAQRPLRRARSCASTRP